MRLILAAIKQREVDERIVLDDTQVLAVLEKMVKQRRESITQFEAGGRADLVAKETAELAIISAYLPAQLSDSRTRCTDQCRHRRDRRRQHQGHGQSHGPDQDQGPGPRRHGRGRRTHQGASVAVVTGRTPDVRPHIRKTSSTS